jgi:nicotinate-nucleotide--dimethylbenzimidazole phosphoribosyltransferase
MPFFDNEYCSIAPLNRQPQLALQAHIDGKTKPQGSLGQLEDLAMQMALSQWQGNIKPIEIIQPTMLVFAADHGIAAHNISIAPQAVTHQMVLNFLNGGAAINSFCRTNNMALKVIDAGIIEPIASSHPDFITKRIAAGSQDLSIQAAMTPAQSAQAIRSGADVARQLIAQGTNVLGFGEMGIGNTSVATALISALTGWPVQHIVGRGTGINAEQFALKTTLLQQALHRVVNQCGALPLAPNLALEQVGGFEIGQIAGAMLATAKARKLILVDGFIVTTAALLAVTIAPECRDYMIFSHCSDEQGHQQVLQELDAKPLLNLGLRLGEGTGAALALPLLHAAASFFNQMASFESAKVEL